MNNIKLKALDLFFDNFKKFKNQKYLIKQIHNGFTNYSFLIQVQNKKYQIRISNNNEIVDRENEKNVLDAINDKNYVYYDCYGNAIKKWIEGKNPKKQNINDDFLLNLNKKIVSFHKTKFDFNKILKHDYFCFLEQTKNNFENKYNDLYLKLIDEINDNEFVLSHNDLNLNNLIIDQKNNIHFIDFEWARINHPYWDYANFIRESNLNIKQIKYLCSINKKLDFNKLIKFIYICIHFALQWSFVTKYDQKIENYRKKNLKLLNKYFLIINN